MPGQPRAKRWIFTLNNYTEDEVDTLTLLYNDHDTVQYVGFGYEVGESGTPHLQGLLVLKDRKRLSFLRGVLNRAHWEVMKGTFQQAKDYCSKDHNFHEFGEAPAGGQGERNDLVALKNDLDQKKRLRDIGDQHFGSFLKYQRGINAYRNLVSSKRNWITSVIVYWGRTGAGKTRAVMDNLPNEEDLYIHPGGQWFDGYDGQPIVLFDDFGGSEFKLTYLLKLLDRYPMSVPIKGGFVSWAPREIYITANRGPMSWYMNAHEEHVMAMLRRITNSVFFE